MNDSDLDRIAKRMGATTPFPVDWEAYATQLITRLSRAEQQRRRRGWWMALAGTLAGAAAAWLIAVQTMGTRNGGNDPTNPERLATALQQKPSKEPVVIDVSESEETPLLVCVRRPGTPYAIRMAPDAEAPSRPFVQRTLDTRGRVSEIRFYGFTPEGVESNGRIEIGGEGRPLPARPNTNL